MTVVLFHRKPRPGNYSIEGLFRQISQALPCTVKWENKELSFYSNGFFKRLLIGFEAWMSQKDINHVTGDVNFITIFLHKKRTVLTMHDIGFMNHANPFSRFILYWFWLVFPVRRSAVVTTVSIATKNEILKHLKNVSAKIKVIYVPISPLFIPFPKPFNKDEPIILQIGTKKNKNVIRLISALKGIRCRLDIIGEIDQELLETLQLSGINFSSSENLSNEEIVEKYRQADIVSFISTYEGFGMPIVEANATGRVVVTSNILSMPEVAADAAHLVDPFDIESIRSGILRVINDDVYREKLIARGFVNKERFNVVEIAQQYAEIYKLLEK